MTDKTRRPPAVSSGGRQKIQRAGGIGTNGISPRRHGTHYGYTASGMFDRWCEHRAAGSTDTHYRAEQMSRVLDHAIAVRQEVHDV